MRQTSAKRDLPFSSLGEKRGAPRAPRRARPRCAARELEAKPTLAANPAPRAPRAEAFAHARRPSRSDAVGLTPGRSRGRGPPGIRPADAPTWSWAALLRRRVLRVPIEKAGERVGEGQRPAAGLELRCRRISSKGGRGHHRVLGDFGTCGGLACALHLVRPPRIWTVRGARVGAPRTHIGSSSFYGIPAATRLPNSR
jgi:hypothetical protein